MPRVIREEFQDKEGNVHYLHTEDCVVWTEDGKSIRDAMKQVDFEDYTTEQPPTLKEALAAFTKNHSWTELFSTIKAICMRVSSGTNISSDFSSAKTYNIGDYCIYNNTLYKFTAKHDAGEWIGTDAKEVNLTDELIGQNDKIPGINNTLTSSATDQALSAAQGKALSDRIGTLASLGTSAKGDLVAAINEVNGSIATNKTNIATANTNMAKIRVYAHTDGTLHFVNSAGADTVLNFSAFPKNFIILNSASGSFNNNSRVSFTVSHDGYLIWIGSPYRLTSFHMYINNNEVLLNNTIYHYTFSGDTKSFIVVSKVKNKDVFSFACSNASIYWFVMVAY